MKSTICLLAFAASFYSAAGPRANAQSTNALKVYTAIEVEFETEIAKTYTLQGAVNLTNWTDVGNSVLGSGRSLHRIYSTRNGESANYAVYRLLIEDGPTNGYAPWSIAGVRVRMDDSSASNEVEYATATSGRDIYKSADDEFTYEYTRLSENESSISRSYGPDRNEVLSYAYSGPGVGTWVREEYSQGHLDRRELGVFRYVSYGTNAPGTNYPPIVTTSQPPLPPNVLTGLVYYVHSGAIPDKLTFNSETVGYAYPGTSVVNSGRHNEASPAGNIFTYTYNILSSNAATLVLNFGYYGLGGDRNEYDLTFTDGPSGLFSRRIYRLGSLFTTDNGAFTPYAQLPTPPGATNNPPAVTNDPPVTPRGLTYTMNDETPERLVFQSGAGGIQYDDSAPSDFTYTYSAAGGKKFSLLVRFKSDRWDEYDLTFADGNSGSFVRRQYRNGTLNKTVSNSFTLTLTGN